ncbi:DgyrCDS12336 [Dimorphilus gyrociliatus]|uniref:DgyrCDS12336 n=1 Tax=Dimorphilus gyrociliatus TaxID=2664684 RepID=A0A7I8W8J4_9ANNE|nr:DgyrCDS12336 [Dimorphilus gyrociliatus]
MIIMSTKIIFLFIWFISKGTCDLSQLLNLEFANSGISKAGDVYQWKQLPCSYLESQNVTTIQQNWANYKKFNYLFQEKNGELIPPPSGIRSSVPLGGISTGVIELRADGTFHEWTIVNQSPAGAGKFQVFDDAFFAIRETISNNIKLKSINGVNEMKRPSSRAFSIRTGPPEGIPGVQAIEYGGEFPVSRLKIQDTRLSVNTELLAYSSYFVNDMESSAKPAISFTFNLENPTSNSISIDLLLNMPIDIEKGYERTSSQNGQGGPPVTAKPVRIITNLSDDVSCSDECQRSNDCSTWTFYKSTKQCKIYNTVNLNTFNEDASSGLKGSWQIDSVDQNMDCVSLVRPGNMGPNGNFSLCGVKDTGVQFSYGSFRHLQHLWEMFERDGSFSRSDIQHSHGAIMMNTLLKPGEKKLVTFIISWYYPHRDFVNKIYGNYYQNLFSDSLHVAKEMRDSLPSLAASISGIHKTFLDSTLPSWLSDLFVNSLSHIRTAIWFKDGRWRQWEATDCVNIDSVHNDGERHIPYITMYPESTKNKIRAWAKSQQANGMIPEQLRCNAGGPTSEIDTPCGRKMSDVSSMLMVYILEMYQWGGDVDLLKEMYPVIIKAADWHINTTGSYGIPINLQNTYDILALNAYTFSAYNSAFHLLAMKVAEHLARAMSDTPRALKYKQAYEKGVVGMDKYLWNSTMNYYNSYGSISSSGELHTVGALMTDTFYAQVLAFSLGLGPLVDEKKLNTHMDAELRYNDSPYGMLVQTRRYKYPGPPQDNAVWMMGNPNWATIKIHLKANPQEALLVAKKSLDRWRSVLNDQWNVAGIMGGLGYGAEGQPYITSHYGYFMSSWHLIFALSRQQTDLTPSKSFLRFDPSVNSPYTLPFLLPGSIGTVSRDGSRITLTLLSGKNLDVAEVEVSGSRFPFRVSLKAGGSIFWKV